MTGCIPLMTFLKNSQMLAQATASDVTAQSFVDFFSLILTSHWHVYVTFHVLVFYTVLQYWSTSIQGFMWPHTTTNLSSSLRRLRTGKYLESSQARHHVSVKYVWAFVEEEACATRSCPVAQKWKLPEKLWKPGMAALKHATDRLKQP